MTPRDAAPARPRTPRRASGLMALLVLAASAAAVAQPPGGPSGYRIGPKDLVEIRVFEVPELNIERRVSEEGTIALPLIGDVPAQGLTDVELADRLKALLESKYVQRASVSVQVREFRSKPISVIGAVKQPGNLAFSGRWTLLEALSAAGGLADGHGNTIYVIRQAENGINDQVAIDIDDLMVKADPDANITIFANDVINVPAKVQVTVFCLGEVHKPGAVEFSSTDRITLLTAIARAGGLTDRASKTIRVKRRAATGRDVETVVDYKRVLAGKDPDMELEAGDVVVVKESFF
ncbi:MAG: polysaccharide biosynthesis/export family protein [Acidobacteriota bacterium]